MEFWLNGRYLDSISCRSDVSVEVFRFSNAISLSGPSREDSLVFSRIMKAETVVWLGGIRLCLSMWNK